jgi:hypothetical protein
VGRRGRAGSEHGEAVEGGPVGEPEAWVGFHRLRWESAIKSASKIASASARASHLEKGNVKVPPSA